MTANQYATGIPIYLQLSNLFTYRIVSGEWSSGSRLESVRELAMLHEVNPNTMQRALTQLEKEGLIFTERTSGRFITQDKELIQRMKNKLAEEIIDRFIRQMENLGITAQEALELFIRKTEEKGGAQ